MSRPCSSLLTRLRRRLRAVHDAGPGDGGAALLTVIMLMFIVGALSVLVLGTVVAQLRPTTATQESTRTVFGAEAGVQTALTQIRTATAAGSSTGVRTQLPCTVSGSAQGTGGSVPFTVTVRYYLDPPAGRDATWLQAKELTCTAGGGPTRTPNYALVTSTASDTANGVLTRGRALQATYTFNVIDKNVPGGMLMSGREATCLQAGSAAVGSRITYVSADDCTGAPLQLWVYDADYHLVLASTVGTGTPLCITQPPLSASDRTVTLQSCAPGSRTPVQLWGYDANAQFVGQNADNTDYGTNCLWSGQSAGSPVGQPLKAGGGSDTCRGDNSDWGSFAPEPRVGAGAAGLATGQIVNYEQFGRCMDVTGFHIDWYRHIVYPCKQDPSPGMTHLAWNHKWFYGAETGVRAEPRGATAMPTRIRVFKDGTDEYCFSAPAAGVDPAYLTFRTCDGSAAQKFTRTYATGDPATSYQFRTSDGRCVAAGPTVTEGLQVSAMVAAACTTSPAQKWNAPPTAQDAVVSNQDEVGTR